MGSFVEIALFLRKLWLFRFEDQKCLLKESCLQNSLSWNNLYVNVSNFSRPLREILWKDYWFYVLVSFIVTCKLTNFLAWNFLPKKWRLFENMIKLLFICATLSNVCEKSYEKTYLFFSIFSNFHFSFMCSQNFMTGKLQKKLCRLLQYVNQNLFIAQTLNNIFD